MATLKLEVITPDAKIYDGDAEFVELPGAEGDMGVFPQHETMIAALKAGELRITNNGNVEVLAIGEGFAEITATGIGIVTDGAVHEKDIDEKVAEEAVKRAEELLKSNTLEGEELEATQASLARSLAQINIKRKRHGGGPQ
jgi:F-type H+-transporting ATPase subunit epsilon